MNGIAQGSAGNGKRDNEGAGMMYLLVEYIDDAEVQYSGEGEPDPIIEKVLRDITQYQDGPCDIWIGDKLYAFEGRRMWPIDKLRGKWELTYDAQGEYFED